MFVRTERLLLRPAWKEDREALHAAIAHQSVVTNLATAPWPYSEADADVFLGMQDGDAKPVFLIFRRTDGAPQLIGGIGLHERDDEIELGYWITPGEWGQGYVTEAGRAVIALARDGLKLTGLVAGHFVDNPASGRVLEKLGFEQTGEIAPRPCLARGQAVPCVLYEQQLVN